MDWNKTLIYPPSNRISETGNCQIEMQSHAYVYFRAEIEAFKG